MSCPTCPKLSTCKLLANGFVGEHMLKNYEKCVAYDLDPEAQQAIELIARTMHTWTMITNLKALSDTAHTLDEKMQDAPDEIKGIMAMVHHQSFMSTLLNIREDNGNETGVPILERFRFAAKYIWLVSVGEIDMPNPNDILAFAKVYDEESEKADPLSDISSMSIMGS